MPERCARHETSARHVYLIDTNIYIGAINDARIGAALAAFEQAALSQLAVSAIVAFELAVCARNRKHAETLERWLLRPFRGMGRFIVPSDRSWRIAAEITRAIRDDGRYAAKLSGRGFLNDVLLAATAREHGATLITANARDFGPIAEVYGLRFATSFPPL